MSFYTALTGLNGAQADISATSNNIANVGTTGFKRARAEFGDIFATSPLQNASSSIGSGAILKGIKQQFTQGNIASSLNALDLAISGQGFFSLQPSISSTQTVFTRNGSFNVDNDRYVVDSAGQYLMTYPVNDDGSVTSKDLDSAVPLKLPVTSGEPKATSNIQLGVNMPADAPVISKKFAINDPDSYTNSTSITIFDTLGNPTIATIYFIKTQTASAEDPTNKYDTKLVINEQIVLPNLVSAVDDTGKQIYIDKFGSQTTSVPANIDLGRKGSPLYKVDDLKTQSQSQPASIQGAKSVFNFGEEGDKLIEIITDPMLFNTTQESGNVTSDAFWGKDFLLVNVDDSDVPISIDLRPGKYNAEQLAAEVERAINSAYGDDKKIQIFKNEDDKLTIDLFRNGVDGTVTDLGLKKIKVDLLKPSSVTDLSKIGLDSASPHFTKDEFLVHVQQRINASLDDYIINDQGQIGDGASILNINGRIFARAVGEAIDKISTSPAIIDIIHHTGNQKLGESKNVKHMAYSYTNSKPDLTIFDAKAALEAPEGTKKITHDENTLTIYVKKSDYFQPQFSTIQLQGLGLGESLNGRNLSVINIEGDEVGEDFIKLQVNTTGLNITASDIPTDLTTPINLLFNPSTTVEAFFEGTENGTDGVSTTFNTKKIVLREIGTAASRKASDTSFQHAFVIDESTTGDALSEKIVSLGLDKFMVDDFSAVTPDVTADLQARHKASWVNEKDPAIKVSYDELTQQLQFSVDRNVLGAGTLSNFNSFTVYGAEGATGVNGLGIADASNAPQVAIRGGEVLSAAPLVADGFEIQQTDKRYGIKVSFSTDTQTFKIESGTTGQFLKADEAIGVDKVQRASNIKIGRHSINSTTGNIDIPIGGLQEFEQIIGIGTNGLFGVRGSSTDYSFNPGIGLASKPAIAIGQAAQNNLSQPFRLTTNNNENIFNVSVNGIAGIIEIPPGNYVGTTLAMALEERLNQIADPETGVSVGGITVRYSVASNSFTFTTGTSGSDSTIRVAGAARLGLENVPLAVGSVPMIFNLKQAADSNGALFVDDNGNKLTVSEFDSKFPKNSDRLTDYFPLYIDEGELTFDKTGKLISPKNLVSYDQGEVSLNIDFSASSQFAQPFGVLSIDQDGFTQGRLDGIEIDSSGTIRANYTNGQNNPLGKIVVANFNNQNGLKQIGNATYVETAVSGQPQVGEAGSEGFGTIQSGSLERSNVDITEELVNLITAQRNYQASAKAIETTTSLTQTIINIRM
jgi:flagellar hook protein FlgE